MHLFIIVLTKLSRSSADIHILSVELYLVAMSVEVSGMSGDVMEDVLMCFSESRTFWANTMYSLS